MTTSLSISETTVLSKSLEGHKQSVTSVAFSPDGSLLATGSEDCTVKLWDVQSGSEVCTLADHNFIVTSVAFALNRPYMVSGSYDSTAKLWGLETSSVVQKFSGHSGPIRSVAISSDAVYVVTGSDDKTAKLWESQTGRDIRTFKGHDNPVVSVALSYTDTCFVVTGSSGFSVRLWNFNTGLEIRRFRGHKGSINSVAFSPNDQFLATASNDCTAKLWSVSDGTKRQSFKGHTSPVVSVAMSCDNRFLFTGSKDQTVKLWAIGCPCAIRTWKGTDKGVTLISTSTNLFESDSSSEDIFPTFPTSASEGRTYAQFLFSNATRVIGKKSKSGKKWIKSIQNRSTQQKIYDTVHENGGITSVALSIDSGNIAIGMGDSFIARLWQLTKDDYQPAKSPPKQLTPSLPTEIPWHLPCKVSPLGLQSTTTSVSTSTPKSQETEMDNPFEEVSKVEHFLPYTNIETDIESQATPETIATSTTTPISRKTEIDNPFKDTLKVENFLPNTKHEPDIEIQRPPVNTTTSDDNMSTNIMKGRLCLSKILHKPDVEPQIFPEEYLMHCTNNFSSDCKLGVGGYGTVYRAYDSEYQYEFVVKCPQLDLREQVDREHVQDSFRREIATLKRCHHPNIVLLHGYCLDSQIHGKNYLVFEYLKGGALDSFLRSDAGRSLLSGHRRIQIMYEVARSLNFLHKGGASGYQFYHRDVKASNICLDSNYTAKLIDCGLAKFVEDPVVTKSNPSVGRTLLKSSGQLVFGTPGYICPWYSKGTKRYIPACDVYSFGITMLELLTGCLQEGQSGDRDLGDLSEKYEKMPSSLKDLDIDPILKHDLDDIIDQISELALRCIQSWPEQRPTTSQLIDDLAKMLAQLEGRDPDSWEGITTLNEYSNETPLKSDDMNMSPTKTADYTCCLCASVAQGGLFCSCGHYIDRTCLEQHVVKHIKNNPNYAIQCAIDGCKSKNLTNSDLYGKVSVSTYQLLVKIQKGNVDPSNNTSIWEPQMLKLLQQINESISRIDVQLGRHTKALARLSAGIKSPCPRLVWVIPLVGGVDGKEMRQNDWRSWRPATITNKWVEVYFVCQHSYTVIKPPLRLQVTGEWFKRVAPALKMGVCLLRMAIIAGKLVCGLPLPSMLSVMGVDDTKSQVDVVDTFISGFIEGDGLSTLNDVEKSLSLDSPLEKVMSEKVRKLTGDAYQALAELANKDKHSKWKEQVCEVLDHSGTQIYVKREFAEAIYA